MTSIILKKRKLCEAIDYDLQIAPSTFEVKKRIDEHGEYKQLYESILPQLKVLFPEMNDGYLLETLKYHNNDIISAIEYLKYHKPQSPNRNNNSESTDLDQDILKILHQLSECQNKNQGYEILKQFKNAILINKDKEQQKDRAENSVLRKAFRIQKKILIEEYTKRKNTEKIIPNIAKELESAKNDNNLLIFKLSQLEKNSSQSYFNNHIY